MPLYKYLPKKFAEMMVNEGIIRIGTLFDFKNVEKYGTQIGDDSEGFKTEMSFVEKPKEYNDLNRIEKQAIAGKEGLKGVTLDGCMIRVTNQSENFLIYSVSDSFNLSCIKKIAREIKSPDTYDTSVKIHKPKEFIDEVSRLLKSYSYIGTYNCSYENREKFYTEVPNELHPALIKNPNYSYQRELRSIFKSNLQQKDIEPQIIKSEKIKECCEIFYNEENIARDDNKIINKEFRNDVILLDNASFKSCHFFQCNIIFSGVLNLSLDSCTFNNCSWNFCNEALNTLNYLSLLKNKLGSDSEKMFYDIINKL